VLQLKFCQDGTETFGHLAGALVVGLGHDDRELFTAISSREIGRAKGGLSENAGHRAQTLVALLMAVQIIIELEMVHVSQQQRQRFFCPSRAGPFDHERLVE